MACASNSGRMLILVGCYQGLSRTAYIEPFGGENRFSSLIEPVSAWRIITVFAVIPLYGHSPKIANIHGCAI
jgi:hypothetical protein